MKWLKCVYFSSFIFEQRVASTDAMVCRQLVALGGESMMSPHMMLWKFRECSRAHVTISLFKLEAGEKSGLAS